MMTIFVRILVSGLLIGLVTFVARRHPALGGWLAALPLISLISACWLFADRQSNIQLANYFVGVLWGIVPTVILLSVVVWCLRQGLPFFLSIGVGILIWGGFFFLAQRFGWFGL